MTEQLQMNCLGMKCPRPIIEIAKAARRASPGSVLSIEADDLAFESDVRAWAEHSQAKMLSVERNGDIVSVKIELTR